MIMGSVNGQPPALTPSIPVSHGLDTAWRIVTPSHYKPIHSPSMSEPDSSSSMLHPSKKKRVEDQALPPDAGQKPVQLQRRRVWRACESCRRKKIKCDGTEPVCSQCASSRTQCTWLQTKDRAALSRHYVQELEARLLHMEDVFKQVAPVVEMLGKTPNGAASPILVPDKSKEKDDVKHAPLPLPSPVPADKATSGASPTLSAASSGKQAKNDDDVSETFGQLALDEHGHLRWIGGSSTMSLIQSFRALTSSPLTRISPMEEDPHSPGPNVNKLYFPASVFFGKIHALPGPEEVEYPERGLADKLVDAFFNRFHYLLPVVDKPSFLVSYKHLMDNTADVSYVRSQTAFVALVFAVFACAARIVDDERLLDNPDFSDDGGIGMVFYERALILHYISHASIQIAHVQCFVLLSSFLCSVNCLPQAWLLVGQAVRMGQDLGLHRFSRHLYITPIEKQTRRKVWWCVYTLDRMLALALGRPLGVEDSDCDTELPFECDDDDLPEYFSGAQMQRTHPSLMAGFIAFVELYKIVGRVCRQIYAIDKCKDNLEEAQMSELLVSVGILDKELTQWCEELPPAFKSHPTTDAQVSMGVVLCSHYHSTLTTLHRNFLPIKHNSAFDATSTTKALSSARACIRLAPSVKNVVPPSYHLAFFIQNLFSSAVILLLYAMHISDSKAAYAAMDEAKSCMDAVCAWEGRWPGARKCKELLSDLAATAHEAINRSATTAGLDESVRGTSPTSPTSSPGQASVGRQVRSKPRRKSHSNTSPRPSRHSAGQPTHTGVNRRNHSQKRRYVDIEQSPSLGASTMAFHQSFPGYSNDNNGPGQSSPSLSSAAFLRGNQETNPRSIMESPIYDPLPASPINESGGTVHYNYNYAPSPSSHDALTAPTWDSGDQGQGESYGAASQQSAFYGPMPYPSTSQATIDPNFMGYGTPSDPMMDLSSQTDSPPSSSFAVTGLPFHGLDFIRNYTPGVYVEDGQEALWHSFDAGEFRYDPDLQFSLGNAPRTD